MSQTFDVIDGYSRLKNPPRVRVRRMTLDEVKALQAESHVEFIDIRGQLRTAKVNGRPKTWKTRPGEVSIPLKYGMYETGRLETAEALSRLVVRVQE